MFEDMDNARKISKEILQENFEASAVVGTMNVKMIDVKVCCVDHKRTIFKESKFNQTLKVWDEYSLQMKMMNQLITTDPGEMQGNTVLWGERPRSRVMLISMGVRYLAKSPEIPRFEARGMEFGPICFADDNVTLFKGDAIKGILATLDKISTV